VKISVYCCVAVDYDGDDMVTEKLLRGLIAAAVFNDGTQIIAPMEAYIDGEVNPVWEVCE
jgi:hypothetical protein